MSRILQRCGKRRLATMTCWMMQRGQLTHQHSFRTMEKGFWTIHSRNSLSVRKAWVSVLPPLLQHSINRLLLPRPLPQDTLRQRVNRRRQPWVRLQQQQRSRHRIPPSLRFKRHWRLGRYSSRMRLQEEMRFGLRASQTKPRVDTPRHTIYRWTYDPRSVQRRRWWRVAPPNNLQDLTDRSHLAAVV